MQVIINALFGIKQICLKATTLAVLSWNSGAASLIFFIASKVLPFSSLWHKQKAWQQYQLYMLEANKGIYFTTNSLIERC